MALGDAAPRAQPRDGARPLLQSLEESDEALAHRLRRGGVEHELRIERVESSGVAPTGVPSTGAHASASTVTSPKPSSSRVAVRSIGGLVVEGQVGVRHEAEEAHVLGDAERGDERLESARRGPRRR